MWNKGVGIIIICSKQGPKIEGAVLNRVGNLGLFFVLHSQALKPSVGQVSLPLGQKHQKFEGAVEKEDQKSKSKT